MGVRWGGEEGKLASESWLLNNLFAQKCHFWLVQRDWLIFFVAYVHIHIHSSFMKHRVVPEHWPPISSCAPQITSAWKFEQRSVFLLSKPLLMWLYSSCWHNQRYKFKFQILLPLQLLLVKLSIQLIFTSLYVSSDLLKVRNGWSNSFTSTANPSISSFIAAFT